MAGRPRKPTALKVVGGTDRADRRNGAEPEPLLLDDIEPPAHLDAASAAVWRQIAPMLRRAQVLTEMDVIQLELTCNNIADYRQARADRCGELVVDTSKGGQMMSQLLIAELTLCKRSHALLQDFGMNPAARSRVMVNPQGDLFGKQPDPTGPERFFKN